MLYNFFALLALLGFFASLAVHIAAICGIPAHVYVPAVWALHVGVFIVFFPAIIKQGVGRMRGARNLNEMQQLGKNFWKSIPRPQFILLQILFVYTFINFFLGMYSVTSNPTSVEAEGAKTQAPASTKVSVTAKETSRVTENRKSLQDQAVVDRMFSGHWMLFYFASFTLLSTSFMMPKRIA